MSWFALWGSRGKKENPRHVMAIPGKLDYLRIYFQAWAYIAHRRNEESWRTFQQRVYAILDIWRDRGRRNRRCALWLLNQRSFGRWCGRIFVVRFCRQKFGRSGMWWFMWFFPRMTGCIEYAWAIRTNVADAMHRIPRYIVWQIVATAQMCGFGLTFV